MHKVKLFIGSSKASLKAGKAIKRCLESAEVMRQGCDKGDATRPQFRRG